MQVITSSTIIQPREYISRFSSSLGLKGSLRFRHCSEEKNLGNRYEKSVHFLVSFFSDNQKIHPKF